MILVAVPGFVMFLLVLALAGIVTYGFVMLTNPYIDRLFAWLQARAVARLEAQWERKRAEIEADIASLEANIRSKGARR